jgi:hypothetical protein
MLALPGASKNSDVHPKESGMCVTFLWDRWLLAGNSPQDAGGPRGVQKL